MEGRKASRTGYPALAELMGSEPELAIFRTFKALNMLNLLRLQAEIQDLEQQLRAVREEDAGDTATNRPLYEKDFRQMRRAPNHDGGDSEQYSILETIGLKLIEYSNRALFIHWVSRS